MKLLRNTPLGWLFVLLLLWAVMCLFGCMETNERSQTTSERTQVTERHPLPDGGYVERVTESIDGTKDKTITTKADQSWQGAISKGIGQAATGDWVGLAITGATALAAGGAAVVKHQQASASKKSEDEAWDKLLAEKDKANA